MQFANTLSCDLLITWGFKGEFLKAEIKKKSKNMQALVSVPHSREQVEALEKHPHMLPLLPLLVATISLLMACSKLLSFLFKRLKLNQ